MMSGIIGKDNTGSQNNISGIYTTSDSKDMTYGYRYTLAIMKDAKGKNHNSMSFG
jgi:hypothetical protein